jgi:hypothetical protein
MIWCVTLKEISPMGKQGRIPEKYQVWIDVRKRFHLAHAHIQMARELGMNPKKFGKLATTSKNRGRHRYRCSSRTVTSSALERSVRTILALLRSASESSNGKGNNDGYANSIGGNQKRMQSNNALERDGSLRSPHLDRSYGYEQTSRAV